MRLLSLTISLRCSDIMTKFAHTALFSHIMEEKNEDRRPALYLYTPSAPYIRPYFERLVEDYRITDRPDDADKALMISSTEVYDVESGENYNELTPVKASSEMALAEEAFAETCRNFGLAPTTLRCAPVICTGMQGWPREIAEKIYRGTYLGISGNEARRSVVHAISLPEIAMNVLDSGETFNVTDTVDPTVNSIADALAWRMSQKRVFTLKPKWFKLLFGKKRYQRDSMSLTFSCEKIRSLGNYKPVSTVEYLKTHLYDEKSL